MNKAELCMNLTGRQIGEEINQAQEKIAKESNLVVVFGASDDLMKFRGAICDEISCYDGGIAYLDKNGLLVNKCHDDDCPYFRQIQNQAIEMGFTIEAIWNSENEPAISWTYKTAIFHSTFEIFEDGEIYCRGIVFDFRDLKL